MAGVSASNGQSVTYNYGVQGTAPNTTTFLVGVTYNSDPNPANGAPSQAYYYYQPDNTGAGLNPLIKQCNDPHFPGPLPLIQYSFVQGSSVPYGQIQAEIDYATNTTVSSYNQANLAETRGDGPNSYYAFNSYLITHQQDYDAGQTAFGYDPNNYVNSLTNANGNVVNTTHEPYAGKTTAISRTDTNGQPLTTTFNYGSTGSVPYPTNPYWIMGSTDPRGNNTTYTRDANNQVTKITYPDGTYESFNYNSFGQVTYHRKTDGSSASASYDGSGNRYRSTNSFNSPANCFTYYYYDSVGRLDQVTDFNGHNTWYTYNGRHLLTQLKHDDGTHKDYTYDVYGNCTSESNELGYVTNIAYDSHRRPTSVQVPVNADNVSTRTATYTYERGSDTTGNANTQRGFGTMTLPSGKKIKRIYTGNGRLQSMTKGYGKSDATTDTYAYDKLGHLLTMVDANNITQATYAYDVLDRRSTLTDANGHVTTWSYYAAGSGGYAGWLQSKQAPGATVGATATTLHVSYDAMGRPKVTQDASGHQTGKTYDADGRLASVSDANGSYAYAYDALSRVASLQFPDGTTQAYAYDPAGNQITYTNRAGNVQTIQYDDRNRPTGMSWNDSVTSPRALTYDAASRLQEVSNWRADLKFTYDESGLPLTEAATNYEVSSNPTNTTSYGYDVDGNVTAIGYPAGDTASYAYDDQNRCYGLEGYSELYYQGERVTGRVLANNLCTQYGYQANNRISELWHHTGGMDNTGASYPGSNVSDRYYGYAPDGQITWGERQADGGASGSALDDGSGENYGYNPDKSVNAFGILYANTYQKANSQGDSAASPSNLTGAPGAGGSGSYSNSYQYDGAGNRSQVSQMGGSITYSADAENRYYGSSYDGNGNTTNSAVGWTYTYDAEGQMSKATRTSDGYVMYFFYDGLGRLVYQSGGIASGAPAIFCYAGARRIEERLASNNASLYRYFFDAPKGDAMVYRQTTSSQGAASELWYQYDAMGNTTHVSDGNGNIVEQYLYDAYGTPYIYNKAGSYLGQGSTQDNRYLFHGSSAYEWLPVAGLYYCRARMYLPVHGRFLQPDPKGFKGGDINLYRYCDNDPTNYCDPLGTYLYEGSRTIFSSGVNSFLSFFGIPTPTHTFYFTTTGAAGFDDPGTHTYSFGPVAGTGLFGSGSEGGTLAEYPANYDATKVTNDPSLWYGCKYLGGDDAAQALTNIANNYAGEDLGTYDITGVVGNDSNGAAAGVYNAIPPALITNPSQNGTAAVTSLGGWPVGSGNIPPTMVQNPTSNGTIDFSVPEGSTFTGPEPATDAGTSSGASDDSLSGLDYADGGGGAGAVGESGEGWMYEQ